MPKPPSTLFDGQVTSLQKVLDQFSGYSKHKIREGLGAGHNTSATLQAFLTAREARVIPKPRNQFRLVYSSKPKGA